MFIKSITIEGFKSFKDRVEIKGFESGINAITGPQNCGKSNLLYALRFVLGFIEDDSIADGNCFYKKGQLATTNAIVSITLDNRDQRFAVNVGNGHEITITKKISKRRRYGTSCTYKLNGNEMIGLCAKRLLCPLNLNTDFFITWERLNRVLSKGPKEILAIVEEAAGTKSFEVSRQQTRQTLNLKDINLAETRKILDEDLNPYLEKLQEKCRQYHNNQRIAEEIRALRKLDIAYKYYLEEIQTVEIAQQISVTKNEILYCKDLNDTRKDSCNAIQNQIIQIRKKLAQMEIGPEGSQGYEERYNEKMMLQQELRECCLRKDTLQNTLDCGKQWCKKIQKTLTQLVMQESQLQKTLSEMAAANDWIPMEKVNFGRQGSLYDFKALGAHMASKRIQALTNEINTNVPNNVSLLQLEAVTRARFETANKAYDQLMAERRLAIEVLAKVNDECCAFMDRIVHNLSQNFGTILSCLLPGASGSIVPLDEFTMAPGLELQVTINGIQQESLVNLTDVQRLQVALAFVLAIEYLNPLPFYLLDDLDVELEDEHAKNISRALRGYFRNTQFIFLGLQEEIIHNANMVFRMSSKNGKTAVRRRRVAKMAAPAEPALAPLARPPNLCKPLVYAP